MADDKVIYKKVYEVARDLGKMNLASPEKGVPHVSKSELVEELSIMPWIEQGNIEPTLDALANSRKLFAFEYNCQEFYIA